MEALYAAISAAGCVTHTCSILAGYRKGNNLKDWSFNQLCILQDTLEVVEKLHSLQVDSSIKYKTLGNTFASRSGNPNCLNNN